MISKKIPFVIQKRKHFPYNNFLIRKWMSKVCVRDWGGYNEIEFSFDLLTSLVQVCLTPPPPSPVQCFSCFYISFLSNEIFFSVSPSLCIIWQNGTSKKYKFNLYQCSVYTQAKYWSKWIDGRRKKSISKSKLKSIPCLISLSKKKTNKQKIQ